MAADLKTKRKGNGITTKCATLVKKQRARIYILRRCATMLLCCLLRLLLLAGSVSFFILTSVRLLFSRFFLSKW
ncbi:hypothetical protein Hanom_Chr12g01178651 [Helianthus anomalus]